MLKLRHVLHPIRSARALHDRLTRAFYRRLLRSRFHNVRRGKRDRCWCGGRLLPFALRRGYGVCADCGCYVNRRPPLPEEMARLYSFDLYWHVRQRLKGYPLIERRAQHDLADGRVAYWLDLVGRHGPASGRAVEVGCGSGVLLLELRARGYECVGVEPDKDTADWLRRTTGLDVRAGFFPGVDLPPCDLFMALDVLEHSPDPRAFVGGIRNALTPGGIAIVQTPTDRYGEQPPFGGDFEKVFDDLEHMFIFSPKSLQRLIETAGLACVAESRWVLSHEIVILRREADRRG